jgi:hypothetical protein
MEVKKVMAFSKKWLATCMTPEACWLVVSRVPSFARGTEDLHDGDIGALLHLEGGIHETVLGNSGIGVDKQDNLSTDSSASSSQEARNLSLTF